MCCAGFPGGRVGKVDKVDRVNLAHQIHQLWRVVFAPIVTGVPAAVDTVEPCSDVSAYKKLGHVGVKALEPEHARVYGAGGRPEKVCLRLQMWRRWNLAAHEKMNELRKGTASREIVARMFRRIFLGIVVVQIAWHAHVQKGRDQPIKRIAHYAHCSPALVLRDCTAWFVTAFLCSAKQLAKCSPCIFGDVDEKPIIVVKGIHLFCSVTHYENKCLTSSIARA